MITDPIIDELHAIREKIYNECKEKGISVEERHKNMRLPANMKRANLKPVKVNWQKLETHPANG